MLEQSSFWTPERVAVLRKYWGNGVSAAEIGRMIGATRSAVIGKATRIKLRKIGQPKPPPKPIRFAPVTANIEALYRLGADQCRWPVGDPREEGFHYCGASTHTWPYCQEHRKLAYEGVKAK